MNLKQYTDENYIPISDLIGFGNDFVNETQTYRRSFMKIIPLDDLNFVNIVETPALIKQRYIKNVQIKGHIDLKAKDYDFILELAKNIVLNQNIEWLTNEQQENIISKYKGNDNDLTIVTNYIIKNIEKVMETPMDGNIGNIFPSLTKNDIDFINKHHKPNFRYSIHDYLEVNDCSYETGRKSLEKLVSLNLFNKTKVGKKFVYEPTEKIQQIIEGRQ